MMKRYLVIAAALSCLATPSQAGLTEGIAAATAGNYAQAIAEFEPLANAGDPAAQYYLAKLYLEGHGPSNDVPRGVDLMTKAATGNYPEAQAQLGLMYAMGLGVAIDNPKAYGLLTKAVAALPDGTRRAVAVANRDAVLQRMTPEQRAEVGATTAPATEAAAAPAADSAETAAATQSAATEPAAEPAAPVPATTATNAAEPAAEASPAATPAPEQTAAATPASGTDAAKPAEATPAAAPAAQTPSTETPAAETPAAETASAEAPAAETPAVVDSEPEQSASVEVPAAAPAPATAEKAKTGVRIQMASLPSEDAAWSEWKRISKDFAAQVGDLTANVETADLGTKGIFYRLQAGPFDTITAAKDRCGKLKEAGLDCLVVGKE